MIIIDPVTQQRVLVDKRSFDVQYDVIGNTTISQEAVPVIGNWEDHTGSSTVDSRTQQQTAGISNELQGTLPGILGAKLPPLDETGNNKETTRRRNILRRANIGTKGQAIIQNNGRTSNQ